MRWTKPDFQEITLNMEVTGYVNTEASAVASSQLPVASKDRSPQPDDTPSTGN